MGAALGLMTGAALAGAAPASAELPGGFVLPPAIPTSFPWTLPFLGTSTPDSGPPTQQGGVKVSIPMKDGVVLKGALSEPTTPGLHPAVILINAWGGTDTQDAAIRQTLTKRGYVVVEYAPRGVNPSGGFNDVAGPKTVGDVSTVIDWLIKNTPTNPKRIGSAGISYGAGIEMMAAAKDKRLRAVAVLSGWEDLTTAIYPHGTLAGWTAASLDITGKLGGKIDPASEAIFQDIQHQRNIPAVEAWAESRSPSTYIKQINANKPAVFIASASTEHVFPIGQTVDMFNALTTPKHIEMHGGDHAYVEGSGVWAFDNVIWDRAYDWLDTWVAGTSTVGRTEAAVTWMPRSPLSNHAEEDYPSIAAAAKTTQTFPLGGRGLLTTSGTIGGVPAPFSTTIIGGLGTTADAGIPLGSELLETFNGIPPPIWIPGIDSGHGAVWEGTPLKNGLKLRGRAQVHVTITPGASSGTTFFYLFSENALGIGSYITHEPYSWSGRAVGKPFTIDLPFEPMSFDVTKGDRIVLAADTKDAMYYDSTKLAPVAFSSTLANPSYLKLPTR